MKRVFGSNAHEPRRGFPGLLALRVPHVRDRVRVQFRFAHTGVRQVRADDLRDVDEVAGAEHAGELLARLVPQRRRGDALVVTRVERRTHGQLRIKHHDFVAFGNQLVRGVALQKLQHARATGVPRAARRVADLDAGRSPSLHPHRAYRDFRPDRLLHHPVQISLDGHVAHARDPVHAGSDFGGAAAAAIVVAAAADARSV